MSLSGKNLPGKNLPGKNMSCQNVSCPIPIDRYPVVLLAHGGGGKLMNRLIRDMFVAAFGQPTDPAPHDSVVLDCPPGSRLAFTTDSYVIKPLFLPGADIGSLAVYGTVNDLAMSGARPAFLSVAFILEEGLPMETLWQVVQSMKQAAERTGVRIVTGDTKVVDKGKGDGIFINTAGIGFVSEGQKIHPSMIRRGDKIIVNGDIGRHGIAVMAQREGLAFESDIQSDSAPLADLVQELVAHSLDIHCLRDLTRGGLSSALNEIAEAANLNILIDENRIPLREDVHGACEILGFDPLYVACEGRFVAFVPPDDTSEALQIMHQHPQGKDACVIGEVRGVASGEVGDDTKGDVRGEVRDDVTRDNRTQISSGLAPLVSMKSKIGTERIVDMISGEQLPRIC